MAIKLIINGYFRSGTTFVWNYLYPQLKKQNYLSFYEPLLPYLGRDVRAEHASKAANVLHGTKLYQDYYKLPEFTRLKLFINNPNANPHGIANEQALKTYLDIYNSFENPVFLQTNRLHFFLKDIYDWYKPTIFHIIRNPLDVWLSIKNAYIKHNLSGLRGIKALYTKAKRNLSIGQTFEIDKQFKWILHKIGLPINYKLDLFKKLSWRIQAFDRFVVNWIASNFYAIKSLENIKGTLLVYEHILQEPKALSKSLSNVLKTQLNPPTNVKSSNFNKYSKKDIDNFFKILHKYNLEEHWNYIKEVVKNYTNWEL